MDTSYLHHLTDYLHHHPHIGYLVTFVAAFAESIAIVGTIIPGSVTMTAIGVLIGSGVMPATPSIACAVLGAFGGDFLSYWLGARYKDQIKKIWPFCKNPRWLILGEAFFKKHGGKSIVFGRFFGPVRSVIPLVAGMMHMTVLRFVIASIPSAAMWAMLYMFPGILVGALSLELPKAAATKLILLMLGVIAFGWLFFVLVRISLNRLGQSIDRIAQNSWRYLAVSPRTSSLTQYLSLPDSPESYKQLTKIITLLLCLVAFLWLFVSACFHGVLTGWNDPLFTFFRSLRTVLLDHIMVFITLLGEKTVLLSTTLGIVAWLMWRRAIRAGLIYLGVVVLGAGAVQIMKYLYYSPRPQGLFYTALTSSFPSGHMLLAVVTFGFLAFLITEKMERLFYRQCVYMVTITLITLVGLSRLYLGAHWLTDVLASIALGSALVLLGMVLYLRRPAKKTVPPAWLIGISLGILIPIWLGYSEINFHKMEERYTLYWPKVVIEEKDWWESDVRNEQIPLFVASRLGKIREVLNIQWIGDLNLITNNLLQQGWVSHPADLRLKETLYRLTTNGHSAHLPLLPTLYHNKVPVRLFTRMDEKGRQMTLILWGSFVTLEGSAKEFWLGGVFYELPKPVLEQMDPKEVMALYRLASQALMSSLNQHFEYKTIRVPESDQPLMMRMIDWGGVLVLVKQKSLMINNK